MNSQRQRPRGNKECRPFMSRKVSTEVNLHCKTCDQVIEIHEIWDHPHKNSLEPISITNYKCQECRKTFIVCTCTCGNELGEEPVCNFFQIPEINVVYCWPCKRMYDFKKEVFSEDNKEILLHHPVRPLRRNNRPRFSGINE